MIKVAGGRPGRAPEFLYANYDGLVMNLAAARANAIADVEAHGGVGTSGGSNLENLQIVLSAVQLHAIETADFDLERITVNDQSSVSDIAFAAEVRALLAEATGRLVEAARQWDNFVGLYANPVVATNAPGDICGAAITYEKTGQPAKADAALNAVGSLTFVDCDRYRGDILDLQGDWMGAQAWYAKAVKLAPSIPSGYYSWGVALAKHGDLEGAAAKFKDANQKGPHWADPLKAWGDVLVKQGKPKKALDKYDEALKYAPNWKQLKDAREAAKQKS